MIECGLLSGLSLRRLQRPPAGMVICGAGPNLKLELVGSKCQTGFPVPDRFDHAPIQVVDFSHLFAGSGYPRQFPFTSALPGLGLDNLPASLTWPILSEPSCSPVRSPPACAASSRASAKATILVRDTQRPMVRAGIDIGDDNPHLGTVRPSVLSREYFSRKMSPR